MSALCEDVRVLNGCSTDGQLSQDDVDAVLRSHLRRGVHDHMRSVDLRVLMARLDCESIESIGELLDVKPERLRKFLRGEDYLKASQADRVELLLEIIRSVVHVLEPSALSEWLDIEIPTLGASPRELFRLGRRAEVLEHTRQYVDPSFT